MSCHLHIDPVAGMAGDMFLGACIHLGAPLADVEKALAPLKLDYRITAAPAQRHGIGCIDLKVADHHAHHHDHGQGHTHNHDHGHGHDHSHTHGHGHSHHHHRHYQDIMAMVDQLATSDRAKDRARAIVTKLAEAEAEVHQTSIDKVHFHEVGAIDSIVDMLGAAVAVDLLDVDTVSSASLPLGHGTVRCAHGVVPLPAPATVNILRGVPTHGVDRACETVTPTGAAIVAALGQRFGPQPSMVVEKVGYGCGDRDDPDVANIVRLTIGSLAG